MQKGEIHSELFTYYSALREPWAHLALARPKFWWIDEIEKEKRDHSFHLELSVALVSASTPLFSLSDTTLEK